VFDAEREENCFGKNPERIYDSKENFPRSETSQMRKHLFSFALLVLYCVSVHGQVVKPTPTPSPSPSDDTDVVKITTSLIQLDVTITDKSGRIVTDLKPDDIEVYENGERQKITNFSFVNNVRTTEEKPKEKSSKTVVLPPTTVKPEAVHRTIALVVDDLTLSFESTYIVRRALKKFVDEQMAEGDLVAIIRTGAGIGALQQFTNDKRQLYAAIDKVRWNPVGSGDIGAFTPLQGKIKTGAPEGGAEPGERTAAGTDQEFENYRESIFATGTLGAVNYVVRGMQDLPGRKSILLMSDGFKIFFEDATGFRDFGRVLARLRTLIDKANRASVVIYTLDARGLQTAGLTAADNTNGMSFEEINRAGSGRTAKIIDTQDGLQYLAKQTGGIAILNNNDLSSGIRKILDDQSYYLIGYEPDEATFDPKVNRFNKLDIKVNRPGLVVRYRSGFFGVSDDNADKPPQTPGQRVMEALTSPFAVNDISLKLNALFYETPQGSVIRSLVHIRAQDMKFSDESDGSKKAVFDVVAVGFGDNGTVVNHTSKTYTIVMDKDKFERAMKVGFVYDLLFPVKVAGAYQFRIALHDQGSERIGSANQFIEVPNLKKGRMAVSGVVLENMPFSDWQKREAGQTGLQTDPLNDTSLRRFKTGTVLNYGFTIYNAKANPAPNLSYLTRIFRDGTPIFESEPKPITVSNTDAKAIDFTAALALGTSMAPGDYVLQVTIIDNWAKKSRNTVTQFVQFEIID
jgi:VWFA-related protein